MRVVLKIRSVLYYIVNVYCFWEMEQEKDKMHERE
jgi:hypothetical protein